MEEYQVKLDHVIMVGVTKPIFSIPLFSQILRLIKTLVTCMISRSAAELRRHLTDMNVIESIIYTFTKSKFPATEKLMNRA